MGYFACEDAFKVLLPIGALVAIFVLADAATAVLLAILIVFVFAVFSD